jgi:hypothetical protein
VGLSALTFASACSSGGSGGGGGSAAQCHTAREKFRAWLESSQRADDAFGHALNQWVNASGMSLQGQALQTAIDQYNADVQTAQAARATSDQDLAVANQAITACDQAKLPEACRAEFAQYQPIMQNSAGGFAAHEAGMQAIAAEQEALRNRSISAFNAAVDSYNGTNAQHNDLSNAFNVTLQPGYSAAVKACNDAT